jgi:phage FluMu protein Com
MIHFRCPKCGKLLSVPDYLAGRTETCPQCANVAAVPEPTPAAAGAPGRRVRPSPGGAPPALRQRRRSNTPLLAVGIGAALTGLVAVAVVLSLRGPRVQRAQGDLDLAQARAAAREMHRCSLIGVAYIPKQPADPATAIRWKLTNHTQKIVYSASGVVCICGLDGRCLCEHRVACRSPVRAGESVNMLCYWPPENEPMRQRLEASPETLAIHFRAREVLYADGTSETFD